MIRINLSPAVRCSAPLCKSTSLRSNGLCYACYDRVRKDSDEQRAKGREHKREKRKDPAVQQYHRDYQAARRADPAYVQACKDYRQTPEFRAWRYNTSVEVIRRLTAQGCSIEGCAREATDIDHCHTTGRVRGHLCRSHNVALGYYQKNRDTREPRAEFERYLDPANWPTEST